MKLPRRTAAFFCMALALIACGCGYSMSPTPYGLTEPLSVSVPVAVNQSRFSDLGPLLTKDIITRLDTSSNITVRENADTRLSLTIKSISVTGGARMPSISNNGLPTDSASRVIYMTVEAVLKKPAPEGGQPQVRRQIFSGEKNFLVSSDQAMVDQRQREAFQWLVNDLGQKISQTMFSEF